MPYLYEEEATVTVPLRHRYTHLEEEEEAAMDAADAGFVGEDDLCGAVGAAREPREEEADERGVHHHENHRLREWHEGVA